MSKAEKVLIESSERSTSYTTHTVETKIKGNDSVAVRLVTHRNGGGLHVDINLDGNGSFMIPCLPMDLACALEVALGKIRAMIEADA